MSMDEMETPDAEGTAASPHTAEAGTREGAEVGGAEMATTDGDVDEGGVLPVPDGPMATMPSAELKAIVEALVFASPEPLTPKVLCKILATEPKEDVLAAVASLQADYADRAGLAWVEVAGGHQIVTRPELHEWVRRLFHERSTQKLTVQALETLAVIAYKQPITSAEIAEVRGVNTSGVLSTLLERHLIKIVGRKNVVGRPFLYATTKEFLIRFGLNDLTDLPRIEDMAQALGFDPPAGLLELAPADDMLPLTEGGDAEEPSLGLSASASDAWPADETTPAETSQAETTQAGGPAVEPTSAATTASGQDVRQTASTPEPDAPSE